MSRSKEHDFFEKTKGQSHEPIGSKLSLLDESNLSPFSSENMGKRDTRIFPEPLENLGSGKCVTGVGSFLMICGPKELKTKHSS